MSFPAKDSICPRFHVLETGFSLKTFPLIKFDVVTAPPVKAGDFLLMASIFFLNVILELAVRWTHGLKWLSCFPLIESLFIVKPSWEYSRPHSWYSSWSTWTDYWDETSCSPSIWRRTTMTLTSAWREKISGLQSSLNFDPMVKDLLSPANHLFTLMDHRVLASNLRDLLVLLVWFHLRPLSWE